MWYTCISGYRKRTPHFRLLPMVKCPLDCFLVYSFLLDVEQAKIRHAPFGTFAFSDKPLRNPSEHSDFWYIQGRIFSSCGLSETQGLPRSLVRFRAHRGDYEYVTNCITFNWVIDKHMRYHYKNIEQTCGYTSAQYFALLFF